LNKDSNQPPAKALLNGKFSWHWQAGNSTRDVSQAGNLAFGYRCHGLPQRQVDVVAEKVGTAIAQEYGHTTRMATAR
jgi:hypothetical protein